MEKQESKTQKILRSHKTQLGLSLVVVSLSLMHPQITKSTCGGPHYGDCDTVGSNLVCVSGTTDFWDDCAPGY